MEHERALKRAATSLYPERRLPYRSKARRRMFKSAIPMGMPVQFITKMVYCSEFSLDPADGTAVVKVFRANDLYDPDYAVGGHQPSPFDQFCAFYSNFCVLSSKIELWPVPKDVTAQTPCYYGIKLDTDPASTTGLTAEYAYEGDWTSKPAPVAMNQLAGSTTAFAGVRHNYFSLKKYFRSKDWRDPTWQCTAAASPTTVAYFICWAAGVNNANAGAQIFMARITYTVMCHKPVTETHS